jgi:tRNA1(Val) A37 N6-methylase TrmN6
MQRAGFSAKPACRTNCAPMTERVVTKPRADFTEDAFLGGRLLLCQPRSGHRAGHDAMLLAAATAAKPGQRVVDFGAGVGAAGLAVASRVAGISLVLVEIDDGLAELARGNAARNAIAAQTVVLDVTADADAFVAAGLPPDSADVVLMNPPFNDPSRHRASPHKAREVAHVATATTLADWVHAARRTLKSGGTLTLIWRADGLAEVLAALERGFGSLAILPVHGDPEAPAIRVLVRAIKGGKAPTCLYPALMLNDKPSMPNGRAQEVLAGRTVLPLANL